MTNVRYLTVVQIAVGEVDIGIELGRVVTKCCWLELSNVFTAILGVFNLRWHMVAINHNKVVLVCRMSTIFIFSRLLLERGLVIGVVIHLTYCARCGYVDDRLYYI